MALGEVSAHCRCVFIAKLYDYKYYWKTKLDWMLGKVSTEEGFIRTSAVILNAVISTSISINAHEREMSNWLSLDENKLEFLGRG